MCALYHADLRLLVDAVSRTSGRLRTVFAAINASTGLSDMEMTVLNAVSNAATPPTVARIGRSLGHPRQVIQRAAHQLTARGLINTQANPDHKRAQLLRATPAGLAIRNAADTQAARISEHLAARLDASLVRDATALLNRIREQIEIHTRETVHD